MGVTCRIDIPALRKQDLWFSHPSAASKIRTDLPSDLLPLVVLLLLFVFFLLTGKAQGGWTDAGITDSRDAWNRAPPRDGGLPSYANRTSRSGLEAVWMGMDTL